MKWPPYLLKLRFKDDRHEVGLWLPIFLLGPVALVFVLAFFVILLVFAILATVFAWQVRWWKPVILGMPALLRLFWSLRGLILDVEGRGGHVEVKFY